MWPDRKPGHNTKVQEVCFASFSLSLFLVGKKFKRIKKLFFIFYSSYVFFLRILNNNSFLRKRETIHYNAKDIILHHEIHKDNRVYLDTQKKHVF